MIYNLILFKQISPPNSTDSNSLAIWALGVLTAGVISAFVILLNQLKKYQDNVEKKDELIIKITEKHSAENKELIAQLSDRNEQAAKLITEFTKVMIDHSEKLDNVTSLLVQNMKENINDLKYSIAQQISDITIKSLKKRLENEQ
jgi:phenylpyruvate tautomerase PptA (4-oxalocrotonate tautomerase family)